MVWLDAIPGHWQDKRGSSFQDVTTRLHDLHVSELETSSLSDTNCTKIKQKERQTWPVLLQPELGTSNKLILLSKNLIPC